MDPAGKRDSPGRRAVLRVLAADDIRTNREMLGMLLRNLGYGASLVDNGREALAAVQRQTFDLVLLDVRMPVMDGLTAARAIVQLFPRASERPRLVALTANALPGDREACLAAGMDDYLSKPVSAGDIEACIQRLFSGKPGASAPEPQPAVATVSAEAPWLDLKYLETVFPGLESGEDRALVDELQAVANDDYQRIRPRLSEACRTRNFPAFVECAHALKGCFASLGWAQSALFCGRAVALARKGVFSDWETWPDELDGYVARSAEALRSHLRPVK
jgi:CheY-like chemotaxis protein